MKISALILSRPDDSKLNWCIKKAKEWADEVVIGCCGDFSEFPQHDCIKFHPDMLDAYGFAHVRNRILEQCTGDWVVSVDTDEEIECSAEQLRDECRRAESDGLIGLRTERLVPESPITGMHCKSWRHECHQWKIFKRGESIYGGIVHEEPHAGEEHVSSRSLDSPIRVLHYGPMLETEKPLRHKSTMLYTELLCRAYDLPALRPKIHPWWIELVEKEHETSRTLQNSYWLSRGVSNLHQTHCNPYATHIAILHDLLIHLKEKSQVRAIEFGSGMNSTPLLNLATNLRSFDTDSKWAHMMSPFGTEFTRDYSEVDLDSGGKIDVAFVDGLPHTRKPQIERLARKADFIVCHDSEDGLYEYSQCLPQFTFKYTDMRMRPWTTVVSNFHDLGFLGGGIQEYVPVAETL